MKAKIRAIIIDIKNNLIRLAIILFVFLIGLFSVSLASQLYKNGFIAISIVMWIIYSLSLFSIFFLNKRVFKFRLLDPNNLNPKLAFFFCIMIVASIIHLLVMIIIRFAFSSEIFKYQGISNILLAVCLSLTLLISMLFCCGEKNESSLH